jgi:hypothetical protein
MVLHQHHINYEAVLYVMTMVLHQHHNYEAVINYEAVLYMMTLVLHQHHINYEAVL